MFFVVSTGRCGSKSIANLLSQSSECLCLHEAKPRLIAEATQYLYGELTHEEAVTLLQGTRGAVKEGKVYGESSHKLSLLIPAIRHAFPEAKGVPLIPDGRAPVASMYARRRPSHRPRVSWPNPSFLDCDWERGDSIQFATESR